MDRSGRMVGFVLFRFGIVLYGYYFLWRFYWLGYRYIGTYGREVEGWIFVVFFSRFRVYIGF